MDKGLGYEGIEVMKIGTMMAFLSIVLIYVLYGIQIGKNIGNDTYETMSTAQIDSDRANLEELSYQEYEILPTATVYSLTQYNMSEIYNTKCYICDKVNGKVTLIQEKSCLLNHLVGKVKVVTIFQEMLGQYELVIRPYSYTIKYHSNGGIGHMANQEMVYDDTNSYTIRGVALRENTYKKSGYLFSGWSTTTTGGVLYFNKEQVKNLVLYGEVNLYAVWN